MRWRRRFVWFCKVAEPPRDSVGPDVSTRPRTAESNLLDARCRSANTTFRGRDADGESSGLGGDAGHVRTAPRGTDGKGRRDLESEDQEGATGRREERSRVADETGSHRLRPDAPCDGTVRVPRL